MKNKENRFEKKQWILSTSVFILIVCVMATIFGYTGRDDSHITYYVSDAVANGLGVININGDLVEQSTTLLYAVLLGMFVFALESPAASIAPYLSLYFLFATAFLSGHIAWRLDASPKVIFAALTAPLVYWSLSGMENSFYVFLNCALCLAVYYLFSANKGFVQSSISVAIFFLGTLLALTRPEFVFVAVASIFLCLLSRLVSGATTAALLKLAIIIFLGALAAFALRFFLGFDFFPNTVIAKQGGNLGVLREVKSGLVYFITTAKVVPFSSAVALLGFFAISLNALVLGSSKFEKNYYLFVAVHVLSLCAFPIAAGGDWMEAGRFLAAPMFLSTFFGFLIIFERVGNKALLVIVAGFLFDSYSVGKNSYGGIPLFRSYTYEAQQFSPLDIERRNVIHARDIYFVELLLPEFSNYLTSGGKSRVNVASIQAGMVPYYLSRELGRHFYFVDLVGLSTQHVHPCRDGAGWNFNPYTDIEKLQICIGIDFDFIYDLDNDNWERLEALVATGCRKVFQEKVELGPFVKWKEGLTTNLFLADCRSSKGSS